ncbi:MAG: twin-arginine translocation signal domain-containing protein [Candidatus Thiodiazotropha sp.]
MDRREFLKTFAAAAVCAVSPVALAVKEAVRKPDTYHVTLGGCWSWDEAADSNKPCSMKKMMENAGPGDVVIIGPGVYG